MAGYNWYVAASDMWSALCDRAAVCIGAVGSLEIAHGVSDMHVQTIGLQGKWWEWRWKREKTEEKEDETNIPWNSDLAC